MRITVSGFPGSGTTSLARHLSSEHGFDLISAGEVFRQMALERNMTVAEFGSLAEKKPEIDDQIDERQKRMATERDNIVIEGRLSGWMVPSADLKIWLMAPLDVRVERILARDNIGDINDATNLTVEREQCESVRYRTYYGIDIEDLSLYHLVLNSAYWSVEQIGAIVDAAILQLQS